jgi:hypothetical protein
MYSELEMFMRKFMSRLGLGYQCHYTNRKEKNYHRNNSYPGRWWVEVWDQRPGHYVRFKYGKENRNWGPEQKWYSDQDTDEYFHVVGPEYEGKSGKGFKDEFLKWLLFEGDFFEKLSNNSEKDYFKDDFSSREYVQLRDVLKNGKDDLFDEFDVLKKKYQK